MKKQMLFFVVALISIGLHAQVQSAAKVEIGSVLEIGNTEAHSYKNIKFPKDNFIIKRGGIASYKSIPGTMVEVTSITPQSDGTHLITIKRTDNGRFFGSHAFITAHYEKAIETGELVVP